MSLTINVGKWYPLSYGYDGGPPWSVAWLDIGVASFMLQWGG